MSATNRGNSRQRNDFYETPLWCIEELYKSHRLKEPHLDPCAGAGGIVRGVLESFPSSHCRGVELDPDLVDVARARDLPVVVGDGLAITWQGLDVIMNPPYKDAETWIAKGVEECESVAALLRLGYLASRKRRDFWRNHPPTRLVIMSRRPSFINRRTDACDYAWFIWEKESPIYTGARLTWIG